MPIEVLRDWQGQPVSIHLTWAEYQELLDRIETGEILRTKLTELQKFLNDVLSPPEETTEVSEEELETATEPGPNIATVASAAAERQRDVRFYKGARGYYIDSKLFKVLKGSLASEGV